MNFAPHSDWLGNLAWPAAERLLAGGVTAVLPVGAAAKQHGLHLPMDTDCVQAVWLCEQLIQGQAPVLVWPVLHYGYYPAFVDYPASTTLSAGVFAALAREILDEMLRAGAAQVLIVNTGISTIAPLEKTISVCRNPRCVRLANVYRGVAYLAAEAALLEQARGGHADEAETSIMLAISPGRVNMVLAQPHIQAMSKGPFNRRDPDRANYCPSGAYGDPGRATVEKGRLLLAAMLADIGGMLTGV